jgi:hypothetical protein
VELAQPSAAGPETDLVAAVAMAAVGWRLFRAVSAPVWSPVVIAWRRSNLLAAHRAPHQQVSDIVRD